MPTPFAALEARVNAVSLAKTANATALIGGVSVDGIFDGADTVSGGGLGMADTSPKFTLATASVPPSWHGLPFVCRGVSYTVVDHAPDGTGISVLVLECAA